MHASLTFIGSVCVCWLLAVQLLLTLLSSAAGAGRSLVIAAEWNGERMRHTTHSVRAPDKKYFPPRAIQATASHFLPLRCHEQREKSLAKAIPQQTWKVSPAADPQRACRVMSSAFFSDCHYATQTLHWTDAKPCEIIVGIVWHLIRFSAVTGTEQYFSHRMKRRCFIFCVDNQLCTM